MDSTFPGLLHRSSRSSGGSRGPLRPKSDGCWARSRAFRVETGSGWISVDMVLDRENEAEIMLNMIMDWESNQQINLLLLICKWLSHKWCWLWYWNLMEFREGLNVFKDGSTNRFTCLHYLLKTQAWFRRKQSRCSGLCFESRGLFTLPKPDPWYS